MQFLDQYCTSTIIDRIDVINCSIIQLSRLGLPEGVKFTPFLLGFKKTHTFPYLQRNTAVSLDMNSYQICKRNSFFIDSVLDFRMD